MNRQVKNSIAVLIVKFLSVVIAALAIRTVLAIFTVGDPIANVMGYRPFVEAWHVGPAAALILFITYSLLVFFFIKFQKYWPGSDITKGIVYGGSFGLLWFVGMLESSLVLKIPLIKELLFGLCEFPSLVLLGLLSGIFFGTKDSSVGASKINWRSLITIALCIPAGRYFSYTVLKVEPAWTLYPEGTFIWTLGLGLTAAVLFQLLGRRLPGKSVKKAFLFSFLIFGTDWLLFNLTAAWLFNFPVEQIFRIFILRVLVDCVMVATGVWLTENGNSRQVADAPVTNSAQGNL